MAVEIDAAGALYYGPIVIFLCDFYDRTVYQMVNVVNCKRVSRRYGVKLIEISCFTTFLGSLGR
jgi:hypothetical protein